MNFMKKIFSIKIQIIVSVFMIFLFIVLIVMTLKKSDDLYRYLINTQDYYIESDNGFLKVDIYSNHLKDYYLEEEAVINATIKSNVDNFKTSISLRNIELKNEVIIYKNKEYHCFNLEFKLPFTNVDLMQINNVTLCLEYVSNEELDFFIGNIIMYKNRENNKIQIKHLKGIVNDINNVSMLVGIGLTINCQNDLKITNFKSLDDRINFQMNNILTVENSEYNNEEDMSTLLGYKYDISYKEMAPFSMDLINNVDTSYVIPLSYKDLTKVTTFAFNIEYMVDGISYTQTVLPFKYFKSLNQEYKEVVYDPNQN